MRSARIIAVALLLVLTVATASSFASSLPTPGKPSAAVWEPLIRFWGWLSGELAPLHPLTASPAKGSIQRAVNTSSNAQTDDGSAPDPYGG